MPSLSRTEVRGPVAIYISSTLKMRLTDGFILKIHVIFCDLLIRGCVDWQQIYSAAF